VSRCQTADVYFDECRKADVVPSHAQLSGIITRALDDTFGAPWIDLIAQSVGGRAGRD
jgi:hypothetical protein